jgi:glutamate-1-semialdehyde 2,1-aminomutase
MFTPFFVQSGVFDYRTARVADTNRYAAFFRAMLDGGVNLAPSQFEAGFLSDAHSTAEIEATLLTAKAAFATLRGR